MIESASARQRPASSAGHPLRAVRLTVAKLVGGLVLLALASALLVPRGMELASLHIRSGQTDKALGVLEAAFARGDTSSATIAALATQRAKSGNPESGAQLLSTFVAQRPDDVALLEALATLHDQARRPVDLLNVLEQLQRLAPAAERQRRLVRIFGEQDMLQQQASALVTLVERFDAGDVADRLLLAKLQTRQGQHAQALATLTRMVERFPQAHDATVVAAQSSAVLAGGNAAGALALARARLSARPEAAVAEAPTLAGALMAGKRPDLAVDLLQPLLARPNADARVLATWAQAMSDISQPGPALKRLDDATVGADDKDLQTLRLNLALAVGKGESALAATRAIGLDAVPAPILSSVATLMLSTDNKAGLQFLRTAVEDAVARDDPLQAAKISYALGDRPATARWAKAAASRGFKEPVEAFHVVRLLQQSGEPGLASRLLAQTGVPVGQPALLAEYARLHIALGSTAVGLAEIEKTLPQQPGAAPRLAWALLATANGRHQDVLTWLRSSGHPHFDTLMMRDVYYAAMGETAYELAIAVAERLMAQGGSGDRDRLLLANALIPAGRARDAVAQLRLIKPALVDGDVFASVLLAAWRKGEPVNAELRRIYAKRLERGPKSATRQADIAVLLEIGAHAEVLTALEGLAEAEPERWLSTYLETAHKAGQSKRTVDVLSRLANNITLPGALRTQIAFRLLEAGDKAAGEPIFRALAANAGPRDAATQRLLFVWGPRPTAAQLDWLQSRARDAVGRDRAAWLRLLTERGAAQRAITLQRSAPLPDDQADDVLAAYLEAIEASGDRALLAKTLQDLLPRARSAALLGTLARHAAGLDDPRFERRLIESALAAGSRDPALHRALGLLAYRSGDTRAAEQHLIRFVDEKGGDSETYRALGELRLRQGDANSAKLNFEKSLAAFERAPNHRFEGRLFKAGLLHRLKRFPDARALYEQLRSERPDDTHLIADFAALLLDVGDTRSARALLETR
jgi:Flp pilus assembly protein TadD